jgi:hypothetical protein
VCTADLSRYFLLSYEERNTRKDFGEEERMKEAIGHKIF